MTEFQNHQPEAPPAVPVTLPYAMPSGPVEPERELHMVTKVLVILALLGSIAGIAGAVTRHGSAYSVGLATGTLIWLLFAWLIAVAFWRIFGRSNTAYNITLSMLICLLGVGLIGSNARKNAQNRANQAQLGNLVAQANAAKQETIRAIAEEDDENTDYRDRFISTIDNLGAKSSGNDKIMMTAASKVLKKLVALDENAQAISEEYASAGYDDVATMPTRSTIESRIQLLDKVIVAQRAITDYRYEEQVIIECRKNGVPPAVLQQLSASISSSPDLNFKNQVCELSMQWLEGSRAALVLMRDHYDRWEYNQALEIIEFEDDSTLIEYQRHTDAANKAVEAQQTLIDQRIRDNS